MAKKNRDSRQENYWPEFFAIIALRRFFKAGEIVSMINEAKERINDREIENLKNDAEFYFMDALEAVSEAEKLNTERNIKRIEYEKKRKAADASHGQQKEVKKKLIKFYTENHSKYKTKVGIVRAFIASIPEKEMGCFLSSNIERTLLDHLRRHLKSIDAEKH